MSEQEEGMNIVEVHARVTLLASGIPAEDVDALILMAREMGRSMRSETS